MKPVEGSGIDGLRKVRERDHLQKVCKDTKKIEQTEMTANQEESRQSSVPWHEMLQAFPI